MGGIDDAFRLKNEQRLRFNLPPIVENPSVIISNMSPATPPPNPMDLVNDLQMMAGAGSAVSASSKRKKAS
jgi:hypothetical protein